jgi:ubiquinone biosynthesis protein COQ4
MEERYLAPVPNLVELLTYPQDSLGCKFASHLVVNHFDPAFYRQREVKDDISYIALRRSQTHDIHHVVTGFGTDPAGELGLQAFQLAQLRSPIAIAILTAGLTPKPSMPTCSKFFRGGKWDSRQNRSWPKSGKNIGRSP